MCILGIVIYVIWLRKYCVDFNVVIGNGFND